ncbi:MAG: ATP-binding protein [DPANN group archaeon]|nr:ATP-binding protein [DPANN group archaeon]
MDEELFTRVLSNSAQMIEEHTTEKLRPASRDIIDAISKSRGLSVIAGLRGTGKTTLLIELSVKNQNSLYINAELLVKYDIDLLDFLQHAYSKGLSMFLLDEIHAIPDWEKDIKIFYDTTKAKIVASGSSALAITTRASELSRRASIYILKPLSFREYLYFRTGQLLPKVTIDDILTNKTELVKKVAPHISLFEPYLSNDALPAAFFENKKDTYLGVLSRTIHYDLLALREIDVHYVESAFKIMKFIATAEPAEVSYSKLATSLGRSTKFVIELARLLNLSGIVMQIPPQGQGHKAIRAEDKLLLPLSFRAALAGDYGTKPSIGGMREDFFAQHIGNCTYLRSRKARKTPDFKCGNRIFEVGGPSKKKTQINKLKNAYLVTESIVPSKDEIPIYLLGLLY